MEDPEAPSLGLIDWARTRGLTVSDRGILFFTQVAVRGSLDGVDLTIQLSGALPRSLALPRTHIEAKIPRLIPGGFSIFPRGSRPGIIDEVGRSQTRYGHIQVDDLIWIDPGDVCVGSRILDDLEIREAIALICKTKGTLEIVSSSVTVGFLSLTEAEVGRMAERVAALARALAEVPWRPLRHLAEVHGLALQDEAQSVVARGTVQGLDLSIRIGRHPDHRGWYTTVTIRLPVPLPDGLRATRREDQRGGIRLGDPVLDRLLLVEGTDQARTADLLRDDDLRGDLLAVVHGHPGSSLAHGTIELTLPGVALDTLAQALDEALALGRSLVSQKQKGRS